MIELAQLTFRSKQMLKLSRPVLWINTVGPAWIGLWLTGTLWQSAVLPLLLWLTLPFNLLIYGVNDISDIDTDATNDRKGGWEGGRIGTPDIPAIFMAVALTNVPFLAYFFATLPLQANLAIVAYVVIFLLYSLPPRLKARRYFDSASNAAYALPLLFVPLSLDADVHWPAALGLMAWSIAKHCYDSIQDIDFDRAANLDTTAIALGRRGAIAFCGGFWLVASGLFASISLPLGLANAVYACGLLGAMISGASRERQRLLYRFSVAYPYVVGTFGGVSLALAVFQQRWVVP